MMNNFTPRAQQVLALARKEADRFNHNYVGTEHLLLGLIKLAQGVAVNVLTKLGLDLETALRRTLESKWAQPAPLAFAGGAKDSSEREVRSVQRLPLPAGKDAQWVSEEYLRWLPNRFFPFRVEVIADRATFYLRLFNVPLLILEYSEERSTPERALFYIIGGKLAKTMRRGRLEFRESWNRQFLLAAIHEFRPSLPWRIYSLTQAKAHLYVMWRFGRWLLKC